MSLCADIKKLMYTHIESGGEAEVISMNQRTFDRLAAEVDDVLNCANLMAKVYGMRINIDNRLENDVMFITDESFFEGEVRNG